MRICIVNSYFPPWIGGAESYVSNLSRALIERGHEVTIYCSERPLMRGESSESGLRIVRMRTPFTFYGTPMVIFPPSILTKDYDLIHGNFPSPYLAAVTSAISAVRNIPSVLTWHNDLPPVTSAAGLLVDLNEKVSGAYLKNYRRIIATTSAYVSGSKILRHYLKKVRVVHNGVDTSRFNPDISGVSIREKYNLAGKKVALFVGALTRWHDYKGVDVLIKAFEKISKVEANTILMIVGGGNMLDSYKLLVESLSLGSRVIFAGYQPDNILPEFYACSDFTVLPSKNNSEGFGLVLLEAMATGKAVVGSSVGGIVEVINDGDNGLLVEPNNADDLARALAKLFENEEVRTKMGNSGRKFAEQHDWRVVAERVEAIYNEAKSV